MEDEAAYAQPWHQLAARTPNRPAGSLATMDRHVVEPEVVRLLLVDATHAAPRRAELVLLESAGREYHVAVVAHEHAVEPPLHDAVSAAGVVLHEPLDLVPVAHRHGSVADVGNQPRA